MPLIMSIVQELKKKQVYGFYKNDYNPFNSIKLLFKVSVRSNKLVSKIDVQSYVTQMAYREPIFDFAYYHLLLGSCDNMDDFRSFWDVYEIFWVAAKNISLLSNFPVFNFYTRNDVVITFELSLHRIELIGASCLTFEKPALLKEGCQLIEILYQHNLFRYLKFANNE